MSLDITHRGLEPSLEIVSRRSSISRLDITHRGLELLLLDLIITKAFCLDIVHRSLEASSSAPLKR